MSETLDRLITELSRELVLGYTRPTNLTNPGEIIHVGDRVEFTLKVTNQSRVEFEDLFFLINKVTAVDFFPTVVRPQWNLAPGQTKDVVTIQGTADENPDDAGRWGMDKVATIDAHANVSSIPISTRRTVTARIWPEDS